MFQYNCGCTIGLWERFIITLPANGVDDFTHTSLMVLAEVVLLLLLLLVFNLRRYDFQVLNNVSLYICLVFLSIQSYKKIHMTYDVVL